MSIEVPAGDRLLAPGTQYCCPYPDASCGNAAGAGDLKNIFVLSEAGPSYLTNGDQTVPDSGFSCAWSIPANGRLDIGEWDRSHLEVGQKALFCSAYDNAGNVIGVSPPGIAATRRDVRFLVSGDPQFSADSSGQAGNDEAFTLMRTMRSVVRSQGFDAPGATENRVSGVIISGDLTQNTRLDEWKTYLDTFAGQQRYLFEGLGNHDQDRNSTGQDFQCVFDSDICRQPNTIYGWVRDHVRSSVLTSRGHLYRRDLGIFTIDAVSPHYSWDWHDVHVVQLNMLPADTFTAAGPNDPLNGAGLDVRVHPHYQALSFLRQDLERNVGASRRPVVLVHHYGFDDFSTAKNKSRELWWSWQQRRDYCALIRRYNTLAIFTGHQHLDADHPLRRWRHDACDEFLPGKTFPSYNAAAGRGSSTRMIGSYLDVRITEGKMTVRRMNKFADPGGSSDELVVGKIDFAQSAPTTLNFANPDTGAPGFQTFDIVHNNDERLGQLPLRVHSIQLDAPAPWISTTVNGLPIELMIPFEVAFGSRQTVDVLVDYRRAPPGVNTPRKLLIVSNDPRSESGADLEITVNIDNRADCALPAAPPQLTPADGATSFDDTPTFSWQAVANASGYSLRAVLTDDGTTAFGPLATGTATSYTPADALADGRYTWSVRGRNSADGCDAYGPESSRALTIGDPQLYIDVDGQGRVTSNPAGIDCNGCCVAGFPLNTTVTLTPTANSGSNSVGASRFSGWSGDPDCADGRVTLSGSVICRASFEKQEYALSVRISDTSGGTGRVLSDPPGIDCGSDCSQTFTVGSSPVVRFTALPAEGSIFAFWLGCIDGFTTVDADQTCTAVFRDRSEQSRLSVVVNHSGFRTLSPGTGTVTSDVPGIDCENDCNERYNVGTVVTLKPVPGPGTRFRDWRDSDPACLDGVVDNGSDTICKANFNPTLLLVDDDDNGPDVLSSYTDALDALGVPYDVWDTEEADKEPLASELADYRRVIWFSGDASTFAGPGEAGEAHLQTWLSAGRGCLLLSSQDYFSYRGLTPFMVNYLGVASAASDVKHTRVSGDGSLYDGLGPYSLSYGFGNRSDRLVPAAVAESAFSSAQGNAGVSLDGGTFRSVYLGFPLESLPEPGDRQSALSAFLDSCTTDATPKPDEILRDGFETDDNR